MGSKMRVGEVHHEQHLGADKNMVKSHKISGIIGIFRKMAGNLVENHEIWPILISPAPRSSGDPSNSPKSAHISPYMQIPVKNWLNFTLFRGLFCLYMRFRGDFSVFLTSFLPLFSVFICYICGYEVKIS